MKKVVIFDLDGTLSDSVDSIKYCCDLAVKEFGIGPFTVDSYKYFAGDGAENLVRRALIAGGDSRQEHFEKAYALYRKFLSENYMYGVKPCEGICELIQGLRNRNVKMAVLSNKPHEEAVKVTETLFGKDCFGIILGQNGSVELKPSPQGVFMILDRMGLDTRDALYLGDTATDMKTGKNAGVFTVGALWGFRDEAELKESGADALAETPVRVLDFLLS